MTMTKAEALKIAIDKEFGPFAHIRINGRRLKDATTNELWSLNALWYCDHRAVDAKFIQALRELIPDHREPIGEQWTVGMIRAAKKTSLAAHSP